MLYLFTSCFPYRGRESFLEDEIIYLSKVFDSITLIPYDAIGDLLDIPKNCKVVHPVKTESGLLKSLFCFRTIAPFFRDFIKYKVYRSKVKFRSWKVAYVNANRLLNSPTIKGIERSLKSEDICYFYWGKGSNLLAYFWKGKAKMACRFHGDWDLWEERFENYAPLRHEIIDSLDKVYMISEVGERYFNERYPGCRTQIARLGSMDCGSGHCSSDGVVRVVSCSTVYPLKRVPLIFETLSSMKDLEIEWTHIGSGPDFDALKVLVQHSRPSLHVNLIGNINHDSVLKYYVNNPVDVFINLSTMEGVPVSIMEAISFGIPIVATDVGGTSEVVQPQAGILVSSDPKVEEVRIALYSVINGSFSPRTVWEQMYNREVNYSNFANSLISLIS